MSKIYEKSCEYCHEPVSVFESVSEFSKHWHERCYIHKTNKEIESYKKKFINQTLTDGDKVDLLDKYNLVQKLKLETTEFKGWEPVGEKEVASPLVTEKTLLSDRDGTPYTDPNGNPIFVERKERTVSCRYALMRPKVVRKTTTAKPKFINSVEEILQIEGVKI